MDYNDDYETLGLKGSYGTIGPNFASAAASPSAITNFMLAKAVCRSLL